MKTFETFTNRLKISGTLTTITALRIGAGRSSEPIGSDLPVIKDAFGRPLIPGSSFKGALRSRLESFLRGIWGGDRHLVANPANEQEWSITASEIKKFKEQYTDDLSLTEAIVNQTDLISSLFGSPWFASKFQVRDLTVLAENWFGQYQERDGVAIDRDTETAADGKLYDFQVVPAGTPFEFRAVVENAEEWELGLLMIGLHQFETQQIPLGGGRSRGLGVVELDIEKMLWVDVEGHPEFLLDYLRKMVNEDETAYENAEDYKDDWVQSLIKHIRCKMAELTPSSPTS
ncbi:type III CRISPR-associated RAMP protein Csx7 [Laspinema olomoucense]|uniref:type III CRISPR-associated RAMP protein Csx7 n=1 Tax=Laspinema olomoucense TaxID=3231600 RepID=UPI0021BA83D0|nr:CRISPR-associated RAMP protein Csx7 [Laspinema sp. D3a]MCT7987602.1 CRISPR-associated RAMP protein Csx7 [Laspinema sp. D3a]